MTVEFERIAGSLRSLGEELDQIAFDRLREAVAGGELERPTSDKRVMQARRAIEKAAAILESIDEE